MPDANKIELFESIPISRAVARLAIPTVLSSLVMVVYNLANTFFVGAINDPVESVAVTLAAPVLLAFNAIINLFGIGSGNYMSRALGKKDYETVRKTSAYGFYCALACSLLFSLICVVFQSGLLNLLGANVETQAATAQYLFLGLCHSF